MEGRNRPVRAAEKRESVIFAAGQMPHLVGRNAKDLAHIAQNVSGQINEMNAYVHQCATADDRFVVFPRRAKLRQTLMPGERADMVEFPDDAVGKSSLEKANGREITMIETSG